MKRIIGIDEVGRGCWAGPLVVGAVLLTSELPGLNDSKLVHKVKREELAKMIEDKAIYLNTGWVWPKEIDAMGLTKAMKMAIDRVLINLPDYDEIIIDGSINYLVDNPRAKCLIKADQLEPSVSAASIVAKVARDKYMTEQALLYPEYGFERHVGYGTVLHIDALRKHGVTQLHRLSYKPIKQMLAN